MSLNFQEMSIDDAEDYNIYRTKCQLNISIYSFQTLFAFSSELKTVYDEDADLYLMRQKSKKLQDIYDLAPIGNWERSDWSKIIRKKYGIKAKFYIIPQKLCEIWQKTLSADAILTVSPMRSCWEYLYNINDLATLAGKKMMKKRNHFNHFCRSYDYKYIPITAEIVPQIYKFQEEWCHMNCIVKGADIFDENIAIDKILANWEKIPNICGGAILVNNKIAAYTIGELSSDTLLVHFEKADLEYEAAYQAINKEFCSHIHAKHPEIEIVNREEDMDDEGLRAAKLSYAPTDFIKCYKVEMEFKE